MLGESPVGKAWAAIDEQGRFVTVAVLDATVAAAPGWREAFVGIADSLAQAPDAVPYAYADFSAAAPWVAYPAEVGPGAEKLFRALGVEYTPDPSAARPVSGVPQQVSGVPQQVSGMPLQVSGMPQQVSGVPQSISGPPHLPWAVQATPISAQPGPSTPDPASAPPAAGWDAPTTAMPAQPIANATQTPAAAPPGVPPYDPFAAPDRRITPTATRRRRAGLWVGIVALVLVVAGGAGAFVWIGREGTTEPTASPSPTGVVESGPSGWSPTARPQQPGLEPPRPGDWPRWQIFGRGDAVRTLNPEGLGFEFAAPSDWTCTPGGSTEGQVKYNCGASIGDNSEIGGELIVRNCPDCDEERRDALRKAEEAWGLQWRSGGEYVFLAETLRLNGTEKYGVVVVAFWRSDPDGAIDRQLVLRMTSPVDWMDTIRRVVNSIRDNARF
ncbi:hypothetical protein [Micromonospora sp. NPDC047074]|uniref:hypothetical protein n=1 Tax=Micromonospora sp. NPDC047074 TaxID=3154339 RepID=UPI0033C7BCA0